AKWKLVHNLILGLHRAVLAEGLAFAEALGLDAARLLDVLKRTPAASTVMTTKGPKMLARDFAPQATVRQHLKDVRLILATAAQAQAMTPLSKLHAELLERTIDLGHSESDNSAVITAFDRPRG
ncbi:MAG: NAD(P)-dependent oxidoreductase, partial [Planctomycetales bacterium]|nr:NAD(P)-dependent oxidoreductase [Planctomycetales bacterium]